MKAILSALFIAAVGFSAQAKVNATSTWAEIDAVPGLEIKWPQVQFGKYFVGITGVCLDGDTFHATVKTCAKYNGNPDKSTTECVAWKKIAVSTSTSKLYNTCRENRAGDCIMGTEKSYWTRVPVKYNVPVVRRKGTNNKDAAYVVFKKPYTIPACN